MTKQAQIKFQVSIIVTSPVTRFRRHLRLAYAPIVIAVLQCNLLYLFLVVRLEYPSVGILSILLFSLLNSNYIYN